MTIDNVHILKQCTENYLLYRLISSNKKLYFDIINIPSSIYNLIPALEAKRAKKVKETRLITQKVK